MAPAHKRGGEQWCAWGAATRTAEIRLAPELPLHVLEQRGIEEALRGGVVHAVRHFPVRVAHAERVLHSECATLLHKSVAQRQEVDLVVAHLHGGVLAERRVAEEVGEVDGIGDGRHRHPHALAIDDSVARRQPDGGLLALQRRHEQLDGRRARGGRCAELAHELVVRARRISSPRHDEGAALLHLVPRDLQTPPHRLLGGRAGLREGTKNVRRQPGDQRHEEHDLHLRGELPALHAVQERPQRLAGSHVAQAELVVRECIAQHLVRAGDVAECGQQRSGVVDEQEGVGSVAEAIKVRHSASETLG